MPVLVWHTAEECALTVVGFIVVEGFLFACFFCFLVGVGFIMSSGPTLGSYCGIEPLSGLLLISPNRRKVLTLNNPCTTLLLSTGTILSGSLESTFLLFQGFIWL